METPPLEKAIIRQISELDDEIGALETEKRALESLLLKTRKANVASRDVARKNSIPRILVEEKIFEALEIAEKPLSNEDLYRCTLAVIRDLNKNTFRSYIKRLKDSKKIIPHGSKWSLPDADKKQ